MANIQDEVARYCAADEAEFEKKNWKVFALFIVQEKKQIVVFFFNWISWDVVWVIISHTPKKKGG